MTSVRPHIMDSLQGNTLLLPRFTQADVDSQYFAWLHDDEVVGHLDAIFSDRSMPALQAYVQQQLAAPHVHMFTIRVAETGERIGTAKLTVNTTHNNAGYGYLIGEKAHWGTAAGMEAQLLLFQYAFETLDIFRIYGGAPLANTKSHFNFRRLGFMKEGVFRKHVRISPNTDERSDVVYYGLLRDEWPALKQKFGQHFAS